MRSLSEEEPLSIHQERHTLMKHANKRLIWRQPNTCTLCSLNSRFKEKFNYPPTPGKAATFMAQRVTLFPAPPAGRSEEPSLLCHEAGTPVFIHSITHLRTQRRNPNNVHFNRHQEETEAQHKEDSPSQGERLSLQCGAGGGGKAGERPSPNSQEAKSLPSQLQTWTFLP